MIKTVVFQPYDSGHRREHIGHIVRYAKNKVEKGSVIPVVTEDIKQWIVEDKTIEVDTSKIKVIKQRNIRSIGRAKTMMGTSIAEWKTLKREAKRYNASQCIHMRFNQLQFALGLYRGTDTPFKVSGILFHPYPRQKINSNSLLDTIGNKMTKKRREIALRWALTNESVSSVYVLNDKKVCKYINVHIDPKSRFKTLPDPIFSKGKTDKTQSIKSKYNISRNKKVVLYAGKVSKRKGVLKSLKAYNMLKKEHMNKIALLIIGSGNEELERKVNVLKETINRKKSAEIKLDLRFVKDKEIEKAFEECDVVIAPYRQTRGSSGIIGHAARNKKPVIGPDSGLIGEIISKYGLGVAVDTENISSITRALKVEAQKGIEMDEKKSQRFVRDSSPQKFTSKLLE